MSYLSINNLYKDQTILLFREAFALEKIHGTSAHIGWNVDEQKLIIFSGGEKHDKFSQLFDHEKLRGKFLELNLKHNAVIYGEAYGGKQQGMSGTYGKDLKFVVFEVRIGESWLPVPNAEEFVTGFGLEFVPYTKIPTTLAAIDAERDRPSEQAVRNGIITPKFREGVVLRPLIEVMKSNGERIIAKHKRDEFRETSTPRKVVSPEQLEILTKADAIATEWVTPMRLSHILGKRQDVQDKDIGGILKEIAEDIQREAAGEIVWTHEVGRAVGKATVKLIKDYFRNQNELHQN